MLPNATVEVPRTREAIAYHEAGHAVIAVLLGLYLDRTAMIMRNAGGTTRGYSIIGYPPTPIGVRKQAQSLLAGPLAEEHHRDATPGLWCTDLDRQLTLELAPLYRQRRGEMFKWYYELQAQTAQFLAGHWGLVRAVAIALLERGTLTGDRVKEIMRDVGWEESSFEKARARRVSMILKYQSKELEEAREAFAG